MVEDKRTRKTEKAIRQAFLDLLKTTPFDRITITKLCEKADISRITFYSHYDDKYSLVGAMSSELLECATVNYRNLQAQNNPDDDIVSTFCNLVDSILDLFYIENSLLDYAKSDTNPYLYSSFYNYISKGVRDAIIHRQDRMKLKYSREQVIGLIFHGVWAFISEARAGGQSIGRIKKDSKDVLSALLRSGCLVELT